MAARIGTIRSTGSQNVGFITTETKTQPHATNSSNDVQETDTNDKFKWHAESVAPTHAEKQTWTKSAVQIFEKTNL